MKASSARTVASRCQKSPGTLATSDPLPCTTSSWLIGSTKFSLHAYTGGERHLVVVVLAVDRAPCST